MSKGEKRGSFKVNEAINEAINGLARLTDADEVVWTIRSGLAISNRGAFFLAVDNLSLNYGRPLLYVSNGYVKKVNKSTLIESYKIRDLVSAIFNQYVRHS